MGERTGIAWTDHTHNPWWGCTKISPGCDRCYAEAFDRRVGGSHWGPHAERRRIGENTLNQVDRWNRAAERAGRQARVFCASMADVFDNAVPSEWRDDLWARVRRTPWLDWQMLTKRPQNIVKMLPPDWGHGFHNVWLGTTAENQEEMDRRAVALARVPAFIRFFSCEPLLSRVETPLLTRHQDEFGNWRESGAIHWVIVGGESGPGARPMRREWAESLLAQCRAAGVPAFFKQVGSNRGPDWPAGITGKGDDLAEWPAELRVQEMPGGERG